VLSWKSIERAQKKHTFFSCTIRSPWTGTVIFWVRSPVATALQTRETSRTCGANGSEHYYVFGRERKDKDEREGVGIRHKKGREVGKGRGGIEEAGKSERGERGRRDKGP
jgi:hypothetical protein